LSQPISMIHILDSHTANQIAAGEVVERPLSVVKELVENAIDSGASMITVRLYDCGCEKIKVTDNGCGMSPEDMRLAVQRHATSKINKAADLGALHTLGFRGEALPSIASVSLMSITSKRKEQDTAYRMSIQEGKASLPEECAGTDGTTIEVDQLFYNAPARKKFLKSPRTELGLISDYIGRMAICHRDIAFTLMNGNHRILVTTGKGNLEAAVIAVFGQQISKELLPVSNESGSIYGLISRPSFTRAVRSNSFFVNGRLVRSKELSAAVDRAYHTLIPEKRYPFTVLFLQLPPQSIDVNVHPAKMEIKLHDPKSVEEEIIQLINSGLESGFERQPRLSILSPVTQAPEAAPAEQQPLPAEREQKPNFGERKPISGAALYNALATGDLSGLPARRAKPTEAVFSMALPEQEHPSSGKKASAESENPNQGQLTPFPTARQAKDQQQRLDFHYGQQSAYASPGRKAPGGEMPAKSSRLSFSSLQPIGQFAGTFILASAGDVLYIIDQHAAAERIQYERILQAVEKSGNESEMLAIPLQLDLSYRETLVLTDHILEIRDLGFILEHFGENSYIIRGVPLWLGDVEPQQLLRDFLDYVYLRGKVHAVEMRKKELFYMACRRAIKGNRYLSNADISSLFRDLDACRQPGTCPHGRPIAVRITLEDINKQFLRGGI